MMKSSGFGVSFGDTATNQPIWIPPNGGELMPKRIMPLSEVRVKTSKPKAKEYKLSDGGGLYLLVTPSGGKLWRLKYRFGGKEKLLTLKTYPEISLSDARKFREDARQLLAKNVDPGVVKKTQKAQDQLRTQIELNTFEKVAREWHKHKKPEWSDNHANRLITRLEQDIFPFIGNRPIVEIDTPEIVNVLQRVAKRTLETAHRLKIAFHGVFRHALVTGLIKHNPASDLRGVLPTVKAKNMSAPTDPKIVAELVKAIDSFSGSPITKCALQLAPLLFVRPGELRSMEWVELDIDTPEGIMPQWNIPESKMKMKQPHLVPLSTQAVKLLKELRELTGHGKYVFPCLLSPLRCMSENTVNVSLRRMGFDKDEISGHGFRAMARTMIHEILHFSPDAIEAQLAHAVPDRLGRAYNRTQHISERKKMMQAWADYLDGIKLLPI